MGNELMKGRQDDARTRGKGSITRRALLGVGAAAVGMAAIGQTHAAPSHRTATFARFADDPNTLTLALTGSPSDLDPHTAADYRSSLAVRAAYETLIALDGAATDKYVGVVAESWEANDDKSVWTFHIRQGMTFHDGTAIDAEAVRASFERFMTVGIGNSPSFTRFVPDPSHIAAPDAKTVIFSLGKPQPLFEAALAATYGVFVVNAAALKQHETNGDWGHTWAQTNETGIGSGPYVVTSFDPADSLVLDKFDNYWGGWNGNHFTKVILRAVPENATRRQLLEQGAVDVVDDLSYVDLQSMEKNPNLTLHTSPSTRVDYFIMAVAKELATPTARQALCYAYPYKEVIDGLYLGYATQPRGGVAASCHGYDPNTFQYATDLNQAQNLLTQAGVKPGTKFSLALEPGNETFKSAAQLFQANLQSIGYDLDIIQMETTAYVALVYGDTPADQRPNLMGWAWWPNFNDAWDHLIRQISCDAWGSKGGNAGFYCDGDAQKQLDIAENAPDEKTYLAAMSKVQEIISKDDPPAIYFAQPQQTIMARKSVAGLVLNPIAIATYDFYGMSRAKS
jgi:peptide/nickel transport system substrate-binding protein